MSAEKINVKRVHSMNRKINSEMELVCTEEINYDLPKKLQDDSDIMVCVMALQKPASL